MVNLKKMDDKEFVFIKKPLDEKEEKLFSEFLKNRKVSNSLRKKKTVSRTEKMGG